jgi:hypothetical protein
LSIIFEKVILKRLSPILEENRILSDHQFGFLQKHSTIEKEHRIAEIIRGTLEKEQYCSAAFDKVWHPSSCSKSEKSFPMHITEY